MPRKKRWYDDPSLLMAYAAAVKESRSAQVAENKTYLQLRINRPADLVRGAGSGVQILNSAGLRELGLNLFHKAARAARSRICKLLQAVVAPVGGNNDQHLACDAFSHWMSGVLELIEFHRIATELTVESMACVESHAIIEFDPVKQDPRCVMLDPNESFYSQDRTEFVTTREMPRRYVRAAFAKGNAELAAAIDRLDTWHYEPVVGVDVDKMFDEDDTIKWVEAFIAPCGGEPGRHVVQLSREITLIDDQKFEGPIPVVSNNWEEGARGRSDGMAMGRTVAPFHAWANEMNLKLHDALRAAVPWAVGPPGFKTPSDVPIQRVEVEPGEGEVKIVVPDTVSKDVVAQLDRLEQGSISAVGMSEESAQGFAPPHLKSGIAISKWEAVQDTSLSQQHTNYKNLWVQAGRILAALAPKHYKGKPMNVRRAIGSDVIEQIKWEDIKLPENSYTFDFDAVSALGDSIPQRIQNTEILKDLGAIDVPTMLLHVDIPDFRALAKRVNGPRAYVEFQINQALRHGKVEPPMEMQDAAAGMKMVSEAYQAALATRVRPSRTN
ncbi:MAG TPA: hypothetical protein VJ140_04140, partial [Actinomycetota bacterium]|nr:hypothetical protein [Actinomycetota bacterium]